MPTPKHPPVGLSPMRCHNCPNKDRFVLLVELAVVARDPTDFTDPEWSLGLECARCASTDVEGDAAALLAAHTG